MANSFACQMVTEIPRRKSLLVRANLPRWLRCPPQRRRLRLDGIEQRPVALLQLIPLWEWRAEFQPERTQHAIVAVIALQHDADERRCGRSTRCAEFLRNRIAPRRIEIGQWLAGEARQMVERGADA